MMEQRHLKVVGDYQTKSGPCSQVVASLWGSDLNLVKYSLQKKKDVFNNFCADSCLFFKK